MAKKKKVVLILGSDFSREAKLPTASDVTKKFVPLDLDDLERRGRLVLRKADEEFITKELKTFWKLVFGWDGHENTTPSLEEHFTQIDLAANSGHHLGRDYSPRRLRAIRRLSIHRMLTILEASYEHSNDIQDVLDRLAEETNLSIVTMNWDIVVERMYTERLGKKIDYRLDVKTKKGAIPLLKMHGSANWLYCDTCREITWKLSSKEGYYLGAYVEKGDFTAIDPGYNVQTNLPVNGRRCEKCHEPRAGRLATFSYRKAFSIHQFQLVWARAYEVLRDADAWLMIGYALPEADYEFKSLLKCAQLARRDARKLYIEATVGTRRKADYERFFGDALGHAQQGYLERWREERLDAFLERVNKI